MRFLFGGGNSYLVKIDMNPKKIEAKDRMRRICEKNLKRVNVVVYICALLHTFLRASHRSIFTLTPAIVQSLPLGLVIIQFSLLCYLHCNTNISGI